MKKVFCALSLFVAASASYAQTIPDGYYRFQNQATERYIVVVDNRGSVDIFSTSADLGAIHTFSDFEGNVISNPGSIIYAKAGGDGYDLQSQGASTYKMVGYYLRIRKTRDNDNTYWAYATNSGMTSYINDAIWDTDEGQVGTNDSRGRKWYLHPVSAEGDNYFGVRPSCEVDGKYYQPFYADFPFSFYSSGMKAYYVSDYGGDMAVLKEYTGETVPRNMPMIIECSAAEPTGNRLDLLTSSPAVPSDDILTGTYFNNSWPTSHINRVENDPATIRLLGVTSDGKLGFVAKPDVDYVPANTAYLKVAPGTADELRLVTEEEFIASGISEVESGSDADAPAGVYTLMGVKVADGTTLPANLPSGVYIVGGKKVVKN